MTAAPKLTADGYERLVAGLRGQTILAVDYFVLMTGDDGPEPGEWDFGTWHEPTMGVELTMDTGSTYSAIWNNTFDCYGLELYPAPMSHFILNIGQPGGSARISATVHPSWAGIIAAPIESCRIQWWDEEQGAATRVPEAVHLRTADGQAWIAAGRSAGDEPDGEFHLCTDDVLVTFDTDTAARAGLMPG
jgi:hypothetical protein